MYWASSVNATLIASVVIAVSSAATAWKVQDWRYEAKEKQRVEMELAQTKAQAAAAIRRVDNVIHAQNAATNRLIALRRDAAASRDALNGVSLAAGEALRRAQASHDACLVTATTTSELLASVSTERRELAEKADGHVNDIKTLTEVCSQ